MSVCNFVAVFKIMILLIHKRDHRKMIQIKIKTTTKKFIDSDLKISTGLTSPKLEENTPKKSTEAVLLKNAY